MQDTYYYPRRGGSIMKISCFTARKLGSMFFMMQSLIDYLPLLVIGRRNEHKRPTGRPLIGIMDRAKHGASDKSIK